MSSSRSYWRPSCVAGLLLVFGVGLLGCNAFEGAQPGPSSVEALRADARVAMTNGNHQRAVRLLETAFERDSTHVGVRIELANALYAANGIDAFTVRAAVEHLNGTDAASSSNPEVQSFCTDGAEPARSPDRFLPISFDEKAIRTLVEKREHIRRVFRLVVEGGLRRRSGAFSKKPPDVRAKGYLLAALARLSLYGLDLRTAIQEGGATLFVDTDWPSSQAFVACGASRDAVARVERRLCRGREEVEQAASWLRRRNDLVGSGQTSLFIDLLGTHADAVKARLSCSVSSS